MTRAVRVLLPAEAEADRGAAPPAVQTEHHRVQSVVVRVCTDSKMRRGDGLLLVAPLEEVLTGLADGGKVGHVYATRIRVGHDRAARRRSENFGSVGVLDDESRADADQRRFLCASRQ